MRSFERDITSLSAPSTTRYESTASTTGISASTLSILSIALMIRRLDTNARTPSCIATYSTSGDRASMPHFTESKRSLPPATHLCTATSKRAARFFHSDICSWGNTTTISAPGSASAKVFIVRATTGSPPSIINCLGNDDCIRLPEPPATMITPLRAILVSCQILRCCP